MAKKVLLVTDYSGVLHITPLANKSYYQGKNNIIKDKKFILKEVDEDEANEFVTKNNGIDPDHISPTKAKALLSDKDTQLDAATKRIAELEAALADGKKPADNTNSAQDVIIRINLATTVDEVNEVLGTDARKTVLDAATKRISELSQQN